WRPYALCSPKRRRPRSARSQRAASRLLSTQLEIWWLPAGIQAVSGCVEGDSTQHAERERALRGHSTALESDPDFQPTPQPGLEANEMTLSSAALLAMSAMNLVAGNIEPGKPSGGGVDFVWIHDNGGWHLVPVDINPGMTINDKALAIQTAINDAGYSASTTSNGSVSIAGTN